MKKNAKKIVEKPAPIQYIVEKKHNVTRETVKQIGEKYGYPIKPEFIEEQDNVDNLLIKQRQKFMKRN